MATLQADTEFPWTKQKAVDDAREVQASITKQFADKEPLPYVLLELIGKGSFGRVYKANDTRSSRLVAVKIINIEEGDSARPGAVDTYNEITKEVKTLKLLSESGAQNINALVDTRLVGQSIWMVTEYCAGGSVATLMKPTGRLAEKWIIPILREVAAGLSWVHKQGIIHRDIKCANVLIAENGDVQLCDFGVAGIVETKFDKRSTVTGTLHWMAPELFDSTVSYGFEVDIWAFGSLAYEAASGLPPNAHPNIDFVNFGSYLKQHCPRLEGDQYSPQLKDLIACCMVPDPAQRPSIEQVQCHDYIFDTARDYPTATLSTLVKGFKIWESQGGSRRSLFSLGGAQGTEQSLSSTATDDRWDFDTMSQDRLALDQSAAQTVQDAYGFNADVFPKPSSTKPRRRRPPQNVQPLIHPLEKVFYPDTITSYEDHARQFYGRRVPSSPADLPLRNNEEASVRESLIDLDASLEPAAVIPVTNLETIKASLLASNPAQSDRRRTQEWTFPAMTPVTGGLHMPDESLTPPYRPLEFAGQSQAGAVAAPQSNRVSVLSLIDLDASIPGDMADGAYTTTTDSDAASTASDVCNEPFGLKLPLGLSSSAPGNRAPSLYLSEDKVPNREPFYVPADGYQAQQHRLYTPQPIAGDEDRPPLPVCPAPPSASVMQGHASRDELRNEMLRMFASFNEHLVVASKTMKAHASES